MLKEEKTSLSRRQCLTGIATVGASLGAVGLLGGCSGVGLDNGSNAGLDRVLFQNGTAMEALMAMFYYQLLKSSFYTSLSASPRAQAALVAAYEEEVNHYKQYITDGASAIKSGTNMYFPAGTFSNNQATLNTMILLEDVMIAFYLDSVRDYSNNNSKLFAAEILGVQCEHRVLGRYIASDLGLSSTTGFNGSAESVTPPSHAANNVAYERIFPSQLDTSNLVATYISKFFTAGSAGFSPTAYPFDSTILTLPGGITAVTLDNTIP